MYIDIDELIEELREYKKYEIGYFFEINEDGEEKYIKFNGFVDHREDFDDEDDDRLYSLTEISFGYVPLAEFIEKIKTESVGNIVAEMKWYYEYLTEEEAKEFYEGIASTHKVLHYEEVTMETPCGDYWC